ncbi:MOSC domain-containing protein [Stakelama sp. CBK3Z-3]|uniref:MOSC domain-containing protein n=1 Tax=Stakelama flava TaxID=2860338 RepID=A0ABS6XGN5_9SPHN|nr:MOSC domain-containing protein [Stakelama flava]MBW4329377.1 MOSC domain-containing protein [Stakelama flava]
MAARLAGIARHARPRGPMEVLDHVAVTIDGGVAGDFRGTAKPGSKRKRQVTLIEAKDWVAAMRETGHDIAWQERRANLLVEDFDLPQRVGARLQIGERLILEITGECDPCSRMEEIAKGLKAALEPDWRGGALARVIEGGDIGVGDEIRMIE